MRAARAMQGAVAALAPAIALAQPTNHIGEAAAKILLGSGCVMEESDLDAAMRADGHGASDFQAQVTALYRGGYLVAGDGEAELRLVNWGACD